MSTAILCDQCGTVTARPRGGPRVPSYCHLPEEWIIVRIGTNDPDWEAQGEFCSHKCAAKWVRAQRRVTETALAEAAMDAAIARQNILFTSTSDAIR